MCIRDRLYFINPFNVDDTAAKVLAIAGLMITWWVTDAIPMPVVALIPLVLIPLLNIAKLETTAAPYACLLYTSPSPRDRTRSRNPSFA